MVLATIEMSSLGDPHTSSDDAAAAVAPDEMDVVLPDHRHMSILDQSAVGVADKELAIDCHQAIVDADAAYYC